MRATSNHDTALPPFLLNTEGCECTCTARERSYHTGTAIHTATNITSTTVPLLRVLSHYPLPHGRGTAGGRQHTALRTFAARTRTNNVAVNTIYSVPPKRKALNQILKVHPPHSTTTAPAE